MKNKSTLFFTIKGDELILKKSYESFVKVLNGKHSYVNVFRDKQNGGETYVSDLKVAMEIDASGFFEPDEKLEILLSILMKERISEEVFIQYFEGTNIILILIGKKSEGLSDEVVAKIKSRITNDVKALKRQLA